MNSKRGNLSASRGGRPSSAKAGARPKSSKGAISSRSNASVESDFSNLSVTGTSKISKRTYRKPDIRSSHSSALASLDASSDSDQAKRTIKHYDLNSKDNQRLSDSKLKRKKDLALSFKNQPSPRSPSNKAQTNVEDWWPGSNHVPKVPPLHELGSPKDNKPVNWFTNSTGGLDEPVYSPDDQLFDVINEMLNSPGHDDRMASKGSSSGERDTKRSPVPKLRLSGSLDKEKLAEIKAQNNAAVVIQKWFRGWSVRRKTGKSAVKKLLGQRKNAVERRSLNHLSSMDAENSDLERAKKREEKARLARQAAIKDLQNKREAKKVENARKAEEEIKFLQSSGVITKKKSNSAPVSKPKPSTKLSNRQKDMNSNVTMDTTKPDSGRPATGSSTARQLDEMFKDSRAKQSNAPDSLSTDRTDSTLQNASNKPSTAGKSTFEDLLESLKQLEEDPPQDKLMMSSASSKYSGWNGQSEALRNNNKPYLSAQNLDQLNPQEMDSATSTALSAEKLQTIINFLDEVEKAEEVVLKELHQSREGSVSRGLPSPNASITAAIDKEREEAKAELAKQDKAYLEMASASAAEVTNQVMSMKIELEEKKRTNELLQRALNQQRDFTTRQSKEADKDAQQRLTIQKQEYEATIQRHLTFIDQLIDDKKILSERCEELLGKLKTIDKKFTDKIKVMEENHEVDMKKQKEIIVAAEKLRREKWITEKTQQIKEVTVKGLEPDIQKLIAKHKAELKKLRSSHQAELLESDERAGRRYIHQIEELREQLDREKDNAVTKERELAQQRFEKQIEQEEQAYQQQRRRLYSEVQEEKERVASQAQRHRQEMDQAIAGLQESHKKALSDVERSHEKAMSDLEEKHQFEVKELRERLDVEKQAWIENYMKKQDTILLSKERELKEGVREARDREIEMVITRLEEESAASREECERAAENRIKRIRNKYESEIKELERSEANMQSRYNSTKEKLLEVEGEVTRLKSQVNQVTKQKEDVEKVLDKLQEERGKVADIIRQEFADRLVATEEDNKRLKNEVSEMRARHRLEIDRITAEKQQEMDQLHQRVKQAISKKEETMKTLREQQQAAMKRADHLEMLLQQQRKKLLP